jgi:hypothetical protein
MQERSFEFLDSALHTTDHVIARAEWSKSIVAIGGDVGNRNGFRFLFVECRDPIEQSLPLGCVFGR